MSARAAYIAAVNPEGPDPMMRQFTCSGVLMFVFSEAQIYLIFVHPQVTFVTSC